MWEDGSPTDYYNWDPERDNEFGAAANIMCTVLDQADGLWNP